MWVGRNPYHTITAEDGRWYSYCTGRQDMKLIEHKK